MANYVLNANGEPVREPDILKWAEWRVENPESYRVAKTQVGNAIVSTVFLGMDHRFGGDGPPILYETMVFPSTSETDEIQDRYTTRAEAIIGHEARVKELETVNAT